MYIYIYTPHINPRYISHKDLRSSGGDVLRQCVQLGGAPAASLTLKEHDIMTGWWFQTFSIFHNIWDNHSH